MAHRSRTDLAFGSEFKGAVRDLPSIFFVCPGPLGWARDVGSCQCSILSASIHELVDETMTLVPRREFVRGEGCT